MTADTRELSPEADTESDDSDASGVGGAANAGGESFRDDIATRIAIHVLTQTPVWESIGIDAVPVRLSCESIEHVDDISAATKEGRLLIQAKGNAKLGIPRNAPSLTKPLKHPFVKAIAQLVAQQLSSDKNRPPLDASRDRFVLAFKDATEDLKRLQGIVERVAKGGFPGDEFEARPHVLIGESDADAFERFSRVVTAIRGTALSWSELIALLRVTVLWWLHGEIGHRIQIDPYNLLRWVLADGESTAAAIEVIGREMLNIATTRSSADLDGLRTLLRTRRIRLQGLPDCSRDVRRIREASATYLLGLRRWIKPPFGVPLDRPAPADVIRLAESGPTVIVGDRGFGKSTALVSLADYLTGNGQQVVVLDLRQASPRLFTAPTDAALANPLREIMRGFSDPVPAYLLIDGLDEASADRTFGQAVSALIDAASDCARWRVIATSRTSTMFGHREWRHLFKGASTSVDPVDPQSPLKDLRHLRLGNLSRKELEIALASAPTGIATSIQASPSLSRFVMIPENLSLLSDLCGDPSYQLDPSSYAKSLLEFYWTLRVVEHPEHVERQHALQELARRQKIDRSTKTTVGVLASVGVTLPVLTSLEKDGVVVVIGDKVSFAHEAVYDFIRTRFVDG